MSEDTTYSGWTNYQTWVVNLHLSNDYDTYQTLNEIAEQTLDTYRFSKILEDMVEEMCDTGNLLAQDLVGHALAHVNWMEIAKTWTQELPGT